MQILRVEMSGHIRIAIGPRLCVLLDWFTSGLRESWRIEKLACKSRTRDEPRQLTHSYCLNNGYGTRVFPQGTITSTPFTGLSKCRRRPSGGKLTDQVRTSSRFSPIRYPTSR